MHFDGERSVAAAGFAPPALDIEGEPPLSVAARLCLRRGGKNRPNIVEKPDIRRRVGARIAPDGRLVDLDDLVDIFRPDYLAVLAGLQRKPAELSRKRVIKHRIYKRGFTRSGNAGNAYQPPERNGNVDILQVMLRRADNGDEFAVADPPFARDFHLHFAGKIFAGI